MNHTAVDPLSNPEQFATARAEGARSQDAVVVGGGPAGLMAAQQLCEAGFQVHLYDAMPSVGRKFLLAGKGGLNLTHSEPSEQFLSRFGTRAADTTRWLNLFGPQQVRDWAASLGVDTFVGTSGRVFPVGMKAAPLLRAWLSRLRAEGVVFHMRHRWSGWSPCGALLFKGPEGAVTVSAGVTVLAMGGASWPQLGSDGAWVPKLQSIGIQQKLLGPANCGFDVGGRVVEPQTTDKLGSSFKRELGSLNSPGWSPYFSSRFAGVPLKSVTLFCEASDGQVFSRRGECVITHTGLEGSLIYAASSWLRDQIARSGSTTLHLDLLPDHSLERVLADVRHPRGSRSLSTHLKSRLGLAGAKTALLYELLSTEQLSNPQPLAHAIKHLPVVLHAPRPISEAISSHGGVALEALNSNLMANVRPSVFCCGEMLDWEAPTGGYLITACLASGVVAGQGAARWLNSAMAAGPVTNN